MLRRVLFLLLITISAAAAAEPRLMVLGDSLSAAYGMERSEGWVTLLAEKLQRAGYPHAVVNASISGDTTQGGLARLDRALERHQPDVLLVGLGGNDGLRGVSPAATKANLNAIVEQAQAKNVKVMLMGVTLPPNYGPAFNERFVALYHELARENAVPLTILSLDEVAGRPELMQADGIHPSAAAQPRILELVWPQLKPLLAKPDR
jgi:acyl-CoA thioesterase-1